MLVGLCCPNDVSVSRPVLMENIGPMNFCSNDGPITRTYTEETSNKSDNSSGGSGVKVITPLISITLGGMSD